jgi:hypothetical protein
MLQSRAVLLPLGLTRDKPFPSTLRTPMQRNDQCQTHASNAYTSCVCSDSEPLKEMELPPCLHWNAVRNPRAPSGRALGDRVLKGVVCVESVPAFITALPLA